MTKKLIITIEESETEDKINQSIDFQTENLTKLEIVGLLRVYEQQTSLELLREGDGR